MNFPTDLFLLQNITLGKDLYVLGNRLSCCIKVSRNGTWSHRLKSDQSDYGPTGRVGYGLKYISS